jgi:UDP-glucose:(heptosyl)LPS alpha-1,3-glucosyltransferase
MRIGLVRRGFSATGGAEAYLLRLAGGLIKAGHEPVLITSPEWPGGRWPNDLIIRLPGKSPKRFADEVARARPEADILYSLERVPGCHVHRAGDGVHAAWLNRRSRFEPAWKRYFHVINPKHLSLLHLECEVYQTAHSIIANSEMVADEIVRWQEFPRERIHVVPNGIGPSVATIPRTEARAQLELPEDAYVVLFVGTGWERKGLKFAIEAVEALGKKTILLVAGRQSPVVRYSSKRARFLGPVNNLAPVFSAADVFALPTIYDPFSNACLEALAAGLPVVTTTANGFSEILTPDVHGSIVKPGDADALAEALAEWKGRPMAETSAACRKLADSYSIERNVEATLEVLATIAGT